MAIDNSHQNNRDCHPSVIDIICGNVPVVGMVKYSPFDEHASASHLLQSAQFVEEKRFALVLFLGVFCFECRRFGRGVLHPGLLHEIAGTRI